MTETTTAALIAEYDARMSGRFVRCNIGTARFASRQNKIDAIVDELMNRADNGDAEADAWFATS